MEKFFDLDVQVNSVAPSANVSPEVWSGGCFRSIFVSDCIEDQM
ncbi:FDLD family class I lanthipeptide [Tumebacillus algifaecis]|nr:FDLD family class I lanthipeptide [Tumebacillus algifaecis]